MDEGTAPPLKVDTEQLDAAVVLRAEGEVDSYTADLLRDKLSTAFSAGLPVVLDLSAVAFFASAGLSVLVEYHQLGEERDTPLRLVTPAGSVLRALRATTLNETLELYFSLPEALAGR
ncbi:STAS domain-containing protein [Lentzea sp. BCCO 10_0856]|uniref:Anti-sigma factor antagonist n=1 Tax=Lentzea miocenica TaxID=3095431 RepID=A0ABU4TB78_9PSEU|nr:STAS domain-containing protein [Lentzea sp. BCCO 10_0856]MDX8035304.1 STAS domain-containing protein [Lentzea sp. BCCO 10_0856]